MNDFDFGHLMSDNAFLTPLRGTSGLSIAVCHVGDSTRDVVTKFAGKNYALFTLDGAVACPTHFGEVNPLPPGIFHLCGIVLRAINGIAVCNCVRDIMRLDKRRFYKEGVPFEMPVVRRNSVPGGFYVSNQWKKCRNPNCCHMLCDRCLRHTPGSFVCSVHCLRELVQFMRGPFAVAPQHNCQWGYPVWLLGNEVWSQMPVDRYQGCEGLMELLEDNNFLEHNTQSNAVKVEILYCPYLKEEGDIFCQQHNQECNLIIQNLLPGF